MIVIDKSKGFVFNTEEELYNHFGKEIEFLEEQYFKWRSEKDFPEERFVEFEDNLAELLDDPDEIWLDTSSIEGTELAIFLREFEPDSEDDEGLFHVAVTYVTEDVPSFVYLHFPTRDIDILERYQRGDLAFSRAHLMAPPGALDGDALLEGDELASGLYGAMLLVRAESDIKEEDFETYAHLREESIEEADEIWRTNDSMGNILVSFIRDHSELEKDLHYVVVTVEDTPSNSHALLFSFPTRDLNLVGRYRHGESLHAEEVVQESSH